MDFSMMPTAAKLVASIYFAALAFMAASLTAPYFPDGNPPGITYGLICALIGFLAGYRWSGRFAGLGTRAGFGYGLTTVFLIVLWCLMIFAGRTAYDRSVQMMYKGVLEAIKGWVFLMVEYSAYVIKPDVAALLILGGLFGGWLTERTARAFS